MTRLDLSGLRDLWYRIDDIFARLTEAVGSISWNSPTLSWTMASGGSGGSVNLSNGLATDDEAAGSIGVNGTTIYLYNVKGTQIDYGNMESGVRAIAQSEASSAASSAVSGLSSNAQTANSVSVWVDGGKLYVRLYNVNDQVLSTSSATLPTS